MKHFVAPIAALMLSSCASIEYGKKGRTQLVEFVSEPPGATITPDKRPGGPVGGLACGLAFGALLWIFLLVQQRAAHTEVILEGGETLLRRGLANHFRGVEAAGGVLFLTSRRLVFKPHKANVKAEPWALPLAEVAGMAPKNTLGFVPNGILVERKGGGSERFVIGDRGAWVRDIGGAIGRSGGTGGDQARRSSRAARNPGPGRIADMVLLPAAVQERILGGEVGVSERSLHH